MKKILFGLIIVGVTLVSCRKENSKPNNASESKLQKVTFNVGFSKTVTNFQTNSLRTNSTTPDTSLTNYMDVLYYMVFDASGKNIHTITQLSTDTAFGHYIDNLQPGTYTVAIAGGKAGFMATENTPLSAAYVYYAVWEGATLTSPAEYVLSQFNNDAFISKTTVTVSSTATSQAFTLNRIVSKIIVNIDDPIPAGVTMLQAVARNVADIYMISDGSTTQIIAAPIGSWGGVTTLGGNVPSTFIGQSNYQLTGFILNNTSQAITFEISASSNSTIVADKTIGTVTFQPNKVTLLSGNLFGGTITNATGSLQVTTDTTWNTPIVKAF